MSKIPSARVVRGGSGEDEGGRAGAEVTPEGRVLRLAPREVPRALTWRQLFGGVIAVIGWLVAVVSMASVLALGPLSDPGPGRYDRQATATLRFIERTRSSENERAIYRVSYTFVDESGVERRGESYTTDPPADLGAWPVDYRSGEPSVSLLRGMRRSELPPFVGIILAVLLIGSLAVVLWQMLRARRNLRLLRYGAETHGKLVGKRETRVYVNNEPVMALTFEYEAGGQTYSTTVKTLNTRPLEDDAREPMLYDPYAPSCAMPLDHLPGSPRVTATGELEARPGIAMHFLILPVLFVGLLAATVIRML